MCMWGHINNECAGDTGISEDISPQVSTSLPLLNLLHGSEVTHVIGGSQFDGPRHSQRLEDRDDSSPNESFFTGVGSENMNKKKKKSCGLSEAVNGDFVSLPQAFFFFLQNQSLTEPCPKPACLALPRGKTVMLFIS